MEFPSNLLPNEGSPEWMSKADNAWQLTAATLVGLQSIPGLVILYGSMVRRKWAVNSSFMAFYAFAAVLVSWVGWAFNMSFGDELAAAAFLGKPAVAMDGEFLLGQAFLGAFPTATMVIFQGVFAAITVILVAGALLGRMNFRAWMIFVPLWLTCSYTIGAYSIWNPNGWLAKLGVIDFSGGFVIHLSSGVAGLTAAFWVGPRAEKDRERSPPNNVVLMLAGAGMVWMGWTGFNGGAPYAAGLDASLAVLNTHVCTAASVLTWIVLDTAFSGKPSVVGAVQGMITGLVCITPGAGVVQGWAAILMGLASGSIPWYTMTILHNKIKPLRDIDDPISIFHTHAVAGCLGGLLTGLFAVPKLCRLFFAVPDWPKYIGLAYALQDGRTTAGLRQMGNQIAAMLFVICLNVVSTTVVCLFVRLMVPLRLSEEEMAVGDAAVHGEEAFEVGGGGVRGFGNSKVNSLYDMEELGSVVSNKSRSYYSEV